MSLDTDIDKNIDMDVTIEKMVAKKMAASKSVDCADFEEETHKVQSSLVEFCRTGNPDIVIPGVNKERVNVYRELISHVVDEGLQNAFPIMHCVLAGEEWDKLFASFFAQYNPSTPYYWRMPKELYFYIKETNYGEKVSKPYLTELAFFEWLEIEVHMMPDLPIPEDYYSFGDCLEEGIVLNPEHQLHYFEFPVFKKPCDELKENKGHYYLLIFRHLEEKTVHFMELSPLFLRMIELLSEQPLTGREVLKRALSDLGGSLTDEYLNAAKQFFFSLQKQGMLLGFKL